MSTAVALPAVGDHFTLSSSEGPLGTLEIEAIFEDGTIRGRLTISTPDHFHSKTLGLIHDLASAADDLAFGAMPVYEESLKAVGLALTEEKALRTLLLGRDFHGLFFDPTLTTMAFILLPRRP